MDLGGYIYELLQTHDCVILPELGGFITRKEGAIIHSVQNLFAPPTRSVIFNEQLVHNDGLLANFIAAKESVDYEVALRSLMFEINKILFSLYKGERVEFTQIGTLNIKSEHLQFEANTGLYIQEDNFGLNSFIMPLIQRERNFQPKSIEPTFDDTSKPNRHIGRYVSIAASIVVLLGCFSYFMLFQKQSNINFGNLCPEFKSWFSTSESIETVKPLPEQKQTIPFIKPDIFKDIVFEDSTPEVEEIKDPVAEESTSSNIEADPTKTETEQEAVSVSEISSKFYYVIGASYELRVNAEKKCEEFKALGFDAAVLEAPDINRFRVSYGSFATSKEASVLLKEIRNTYRRDAWILKHK